MQAGHAPFTLQVPEIFAPGSVHLVVSVIPRIEASTATTLSSLASTSTLHFIATLVSANHYTIVIYTIVSSLRDGRSGALQLLVSLRQWPWIPIRHGK